MMYLLLFINIGLLVGGQMLWKVGVSSIHSWSFSALMELIKSPWFIGGAGLYAIATVLWLYILSKMPLSVAYPFQSLSYVFGIVLAAYIFKENVSMTQWIGVAVIMVGVYLIAK